VVHGLTTAISISHTDGRTSVNCRVDKRQKSTPSWTARHGRRARWRPWARAAEADSASESSLNHRGSEESTRLLSTNPLHNRGLRQVICCCSSSRHTTQSECSHYEPKHTCTIHCSNVLVFSAGFQLCQYKNVLFHSLAMSIWTKIWRRKAYPPARGVVLKRSGGTPETRLRQRFSNNLGLHTRTLIHVRKIATADLWSCPAIQLLVFEC